MIRSTLSRYKRTSTHSTIYRVTEKNEAQLSLNGATVQPISEGQRPTFGRLKKVISQSKCSPIHAMVTLLCRALQLTL